MKLPQQTEVVVIGGGVLGTSAAFHLANSGVDVVLLDRGPIASGTTPFAAGQTGHLRSDRIGNDFANYNIEFFENFASHTGCPIDFNQCGSIRVALTDRYRTELDTRYKVAQEMGLRAELIDTDQAQDFVPTLTLPDVSGILHIPADGYVEPKSVAVAYATAAANRGAQVFTRNPVQSMDIVEGEVRGVQTANGYIKANWIVLAAGAWTRQFAAQFGLDIPVVPVRHQAFVTTPIAGVKSGQPIVRISEPQIYVRHEAGGMLVGGYGYRPLSFDMDDFPADFEIQSLEADQIYFDQLREAATDFFPSLSAAIVVQERRGLPTMSADANLVVSATPQVPQLIISSACCVGGINASPGAGRIVADIVQDRPTWSPSEQVVLDRFEDQFASDAAVRSACEIMYSKMYLGAI